MMAAALLVLAVAAVTAEARNIKTAEDKKQQNDDAAVQPQTFPPFDRLGGGMGMPGGGSLPGSSIPAFSLPGSGGMSPGFFPGTGSIGSMPLFGGGSPGFGGLPGSPVAGGSVPEHATKP